MTVHHNIARQAFIDELRNRDGDAYASVLVNMAGLQRRLDEDFPEGSKKTVRHREVTHRIAGMRWSCELILTSGNVEQAEAERRVKTDAKRYLAAYQEDAEYEKENFG
ncbi:hypothetical protein ACWDYH_00415 [Nocardia goodfellowii]